MSTVTHEPGTGRVEAFSDGVFAIAITLLVLEIRPPEHGEQSLAHGLLDLWPSYLAYTLSFVTIGIMWLAAEGEQAVGFGAAGLAHTSSDPGAAVANVYVHPERRRQGIGTALWELVEPHLAGSARPTSTRSASTRSLRGDSWSSSSAYAENASASVVSRRPFSTAIAISSVDRSSGPTTGIVGPSQSSVPPPDDQRNGDRTTTLAPVVSAPTR